MKQILENWKYFINESSLSRVYKYISSTEVAIITAFRNDPSSLEKCAATAISGDEGLKKDLSLNRQGITLKINKTRNRDLKATLLALKYGVTRVKGSYIEDFDTPDAVEVGEESFVVVNLEEDPNFLSNIKMLGRKFCQDSVLIIPKGGQGAYLFGTNNGEFPGLGQVVKVGDLKMGDEAEFMTRVNKRPFTFSESLETYRDLSRNERMAVKSIAKTILK